MADLETICNDTKAWTCFDAKDEGTIHVYRRCPECGKYLKTGKLFAKIDGIEATGWTCKTHGEVEPFFLRD